jgi:hypothetical protein
MTPPTQEDQTPEDEDEELRRDWEEMVRTGRPVLTYDFQLPIAFRFGKEDRLEMDCQCLAVGSFSLPGTIRVRLSLAAADRLKQFLNGLREEVALDL